MEILAVRILADKSWEDPTLSVTCMWGKEPLQAGPILDGEPLYLGRLNNNGEEEKDDDEDDDGSFTVGGLFC